MATGRSPVACMACFHFAMAPKSKIARQPRGRRSARHEGTECEAVSLPFLGASRRQVLAKVLGIDDEGLLLLICEFAGDTRPPLLAFMRTDAVSFGLQGAAKSLPSSERMALLTVDCRGEAVLMGMTQDCPDLLVWDLRFMGRFPEPRVLATVPADPGSTCLWLDAEADRAAAGFSNGNVLLWALCDGELLQRCEAIILESTYWLTAGHSVHVEVIVSPPPARRGEEISLGYGGAGGSCMASIDYMGVACLWKENGHCIMSADASVEVEAPSDQRRRRVVGIATAPELVICGLFDAIVGFKAPSGDRLFVLSAGLLAHSRTSIPSAPIAGVACLSGGDCDGAARWVFAFTSDGSLLSWDLATHREDEEAQVNAMVPVIQLGPSHGICRSGRVVAAPGLDLLCWLAVDGEGGSAAVRWLDTSLESGRAASLPGGQPRVWQALCAGHISEGFSAVALLPEQLRRGSV